VINKQATLNPFDEVRWTY